MAAIKARSMHAVGGLQAVLITGLPPEADPYCRGAFAPLHRWHREVWLSQVTPSPPQDVLTHKEICQAAQRAQSLFDSEQHKPIAQHSQDPVSAAYAAAQQAGWFISGPFTILRASGEALDLVAGSPVHLRTLYRQDFRQHQAVQAIQLKCGKHPELRQPHQIVEHGLDTHAIFRAFNSKKDPLTTQERYMLKVLVSYAVHSSDRLIAWGYPVLPLCPLCGRQDSIYHRLWTCPVVHDDRINICCLLYTSPSPRD